MTDFRLIVGGLDQCEKDILTTRLLADAETTEDKKNTSALHLDFTVVSRPYQSLLKICLLTMLLWSLTRGGQFCHIGTITTGIGVFSSNALILSWVTCNIGGQTKRAMALAVINAFGSIGAALSAWIYYNRSEIYNDGSHYTIIVILLFTFFLVLLLKLQLKYENRRQRNTVTVQFHRSTVVVEREPLLPKVNLFLPTCEISSLFFSARILFM